ncbi:hypothetical protein J4218_06315 [Candidatus Pacearchaeota archaeon]|nr:hypothetical protein [Candidatus Pacearchaeota archaeon]
MVKRIIALDSCGFSETLRSGLEEEIGYEVHAFRDFGLAKDSLAAGGVCFAIVNPYGDFAGQNSPYVDFIREELFQNHIPVLVFSRTSQKRIEKDTGLKLGENYAAYLKKPSPVNDFVECVRGLLGN